MTRLFEAGEFVLVRDRKRRRYLVRLEADGEFHTHAGVIKHLEIIGCPEGTELRSSGNAAYTFVRPTYTDYVLEMKRGATIIYPKDVGPILVLADIAPGLRVLESGVGSGAMSLALLRAGAEVVGYEIRDDFARIAERNVRAFVSDELGERYRVEVRDIYEGIAEVDLDRIVLDLPEPWQVVPHAERALHVGGIILAYLPTINQTAQFRQALERSAFGMAETVEVLQRSWHIEGQSVRPDHRMVAHTGFLTHARLLGAPDSYEPSGDPNAGPTEASFTIP
jgi:tRNA (adenine57-N1/adenine58-N1)-methyltransferase